MANNLLSIVIGNVPEADFTALMALTGDEDGETAVTVPAMTEDTNPRTWTSNIETVTVALDTTKDDYAAKRDSVMAILGYEPAGA